MHATSGRLLAFLVVVALAAPAAVYVAAKGVTQEECPPFERHYYAYNATSEVEGDLVALEHVEGFADFRHCFQVRDRVTGLDVRFESHGGAYHLRVIGHGVDDTHLLRPGANVTDWYDGTRIDRIEYAGVSGEGDVGTNVADVPLAALALDRSE